VKDNQAEIRPDPRKDMIARAAITHRIDKKGFGLGNFRRPGLLNQKLPFLRACSIHPQMFLRSLIPIQDSIVAQRLKKLSRYWKNRICRNSQTLNIIRARKLQRNKLEHRGKLFKEKQVVFFGRTCWLGTTNTKAPRLRTNLAQKRNGIRRKRHFYYHFFGAT
jgi:hypothetical protein